MTQQLVSVVVPVYNGERFVAGAIDTIRAQDHRPIEILVVDDGSTDDTPAVVDRLAGPDLVCIRQGNGGHGAAKNAGVARARGTYVAFLDADDRWLPQKLSRQVGHLQRHDDVGFAVCLMRNVIDDAVVDGLSERQLARMAGELTAWLPSGLLVRRTTFEEVGGFDESLSAGNDTDWFARARAQGVKGAVVDEVLVHRHLHGANQSLEIDRVHAELLRIARTSVRRARLGDLVPGAGPAGGSVAARPGPPPPTGPT